jgi:hypothetical protein
MRDLILVQHKYNNCTTIPHMRVGPSMWDPPSCEGLLYSCCIGVVNLTFSVDMHSLRSRTDIIGAELLCRSVGPSVSSLTCYRDIVYVYYKYSTSRFIVNRFGGRECIDHMHYSKANFGLCSY